LKVVWFAEIKWDYLRTRKQQLISRRPPDVDLLYLEPFRRGHENRYDLREADGIQVATVPFLKAAPGGVGRAALELGGVRTLVDRSALRRVQRLTHDAGFRDLDTAVVISNIFAIDVALRFGGRFLHYDCNDAHAKFPGMPGWVADHFRRTCVNATRVTASSRALIGDIVDAGADAGAVTYIGNGVEVGLFAAARERLGPPERGPRPCIGYLGAIAPWFDFDIVERLARARPGWDVSLVGPVMQGVDDRVSRLLALDNVSHSGAVPHESVPDVLHTFSVGIIPFRRDALTRGVNPNKMYEYLAMGLPVVATPFSDDVLAYPTHVSTGAEAGSFAAACEQALAHLDDAASVAAFRRGAFDIASAHDWDTVAAEFWREIASLF